MIDGVPVVSELSGGKLRLIWKECSKLARKYSSSLTETRIVESPIDNKWRVILPSGIYLLRENSPYSRTFQTPRAAALAAERYLEQIGLL